MSNKMKGPVAELEKLCKEIRSSANRWNDILHNGCSDPTWPDGVNMNLVRNHIFYFKWRIRELCEENGMIMPEEAFFNVPPEVPDSLWTRPTGTEVHHRINEWYGSNHPLVISDGSIPEFVPFEEGQMTLF